jgi:RHS repeat-associated protein
LEAGEKWRIFTGDVYVPREPETFKYDADGNLTNDGRWSYVWDGENRLIQMSVNTNVGPQYQLNFAYDYQGRRIQKAVAIGGAGVYTNDFLYDGWNLVATLNPQSSILASYVWGSDLSGSMQGAGGVGGLLEVINYGSGTNFVAFDGNGNVAALVNAANGTLSANYDYGPFGELIRQTGPMATANPFRFSTKYDDDESDLLYYGYRYYKPSTGTWANRDPINEQGGVNLYNFVKSNPVSNEDDDGRLSLYGERLSNQPGFKDTCGEYAELWDISLDNQTPKGGYIVQEINQTIDVNACYGSRQSYHLLFWEIGMKSLAPGLPPGVLPAGSPAGSGVMDYWFHFRKGSDKLYGASTGISITYGEERFYYVKTTGILSWGPVLSPISGRPVTTEGTTAEPTFWSLPPDNGEAIARHMTIASWSCCCGTSLTSEFSNPPLHQP